MDGMKPSVHILVTSRKPELVGAATLVFKTLRVGFPTATVAVYLNGDVCGKDEITDAAMKCDAEVIALESTIHHDWIETLLSTPREPFWISDTDVVFYRAVEGWKCDGPIMGAIVPSFFDKWSRCVCAPRLHTSLLWFNTGVLRDKIEKFQNSVRVSRFTPLINLVAPVVTPPHTFYDTCSMLYAAVGGQSFSVEQLEAYEHLNGATWADELEDTYPGINRLHQDIYRNPELARGSHEAMHRFYIGTKPTVKEFCDEVCMGDREATEFCTVWFNYVHAIDDLIDHPTRPTPEDLLTTFAMANVLYTTPFYQRNSAHLHPIVLQITNAYADSVLWEKSSMNRRRTISDVLRCVGNEMFFVVAYIIGGWPHRRAVSAKIRERSWELQHDAQDNPT